MSPRLIGVELGYCLYPTQRVFFAVRVQLRYLLSDPRTHRSGAGVRDDKSELAQSTFSASISHALHPLRRLHHRLTHGLPLEDVTRYERIAITPLRSCGRNGARADRLVPCVPRIARWRKAGCSIRRP